MMAVEAFKIILDKVQDLMMRYPVLTIIKFIFFTYIPCLISVATGGSFWASKINLLFVQFDYGAIPLFLTIAFFISIPAIFYIRNDLKKYRKEQLANLAAAFSKTQQAIDNFKNEREQSFNEARKRITEMANKKE